MRTVLIASLLSLLAASAPLIAAAGSKDRPEAERKAIAAARNAGASVMELAQDDPRLVVTYHLATEKVTGERLAAVAKLPRVVELNLRGTDVSNEDLKYLAGFDELERLHLEKTA